MNKTAWTVVAFDETHYWSEDIVARAGRLFGIYMFDANRHVYCCELTPSYEMWFIETVHTKDCFDEVHEEVLEADFVDRTTVSYYHCRGIDRMDAKWKETLTEHDVEYEEVDVEYEEVDDTGKVWDQLRDDMLEYIHGNQVVPVGVPFEVE